MSYKHDMAALQIELVKWQYWIKNTKQKVVIIFEGRDAAGKGGTIKRLIENLNPRGYNLVALAAPTERERSQWYFQRYVEHLPAAGELTIFDRSWYNRAGVEKVMGFCSDEEYRQFLEDCPKFEEMLVKSGIKLVKYWFSVHPDVQAERLQARAQDPLKRWKLSDMDRQSRLKWAEFSQAKDVMLQATDNAISPWYLVDADDKKSARINCLSHLLGLFDYQQQQLDEIKVEFDDIEEAPSRMAIDAMKWVPKRFGGKG